MSNYQHFYDLPVYKICRDFRKQVAAIVKERLPKTEEYMLKNQILRSGRSVTANIAEGFGRFHYQENIQYCRQGRGSLAETMEHIIVAFDEKYIGEELLTVLNNNYKTCLKELNTYIKYLKSAKETNNQ